MIKDNHIVAAGGVAAAVKQVREASHHLLRIEVEVGDLTQLEEALAVEADVILLDNMTDEMLSDAVLKTRELRPQTILEASGNMTPERIARIKHVGVDVVSAGGLIHQATWVDLSMTLHDL